MERNRGRKLHIWLNVFSNLFLQSTSTTNGPNLESGPQIQPLFNTAPDGTPLGPNGQPLPPPIQPPPGSVTKLAPNATLNDLNKIKKDHDGEKPFKIEQVTVLIDESDDVKVLKLLPVSCAAFVITLIT